MLQTSSANDLPDKANS